MSVVIVGVIRRKPVLTHASIVCEGMLASVNSVNLILTHHISYISDHHFLSILHSRYPSIVPFILSLLGPAA